MKYRTSFLKYADHDIDIIEEYLAQFTNHRLISTRKQVPNPVIAREYACFADTSPRSIEQAGAP